MCDPVDQREALAEQGRLGRLGGIEGASPEPAPYAVYVPFAEYQRLLKNDADLKNTHLAIRDLTKKLQEAGDTMLRYQAVLQSIRNRIDGSLL